MNHARLPVVHLALSALVVFVALGISPLPAAEPAAPAPPDTRRQQLAEAIQTAMQEHGVPGVSVAIIDDYKIDWADGFGVRSASGDEPVTPETMFQAASISKPVTAVATLKLVQEGRLDLDAKVNDLLKSWQIPDGNVTREHPIRLRHLLSHSAGLTVHGFEGYATTAPCPTLLEVLAGREPANSAAIKPFIKPGYQFKYSGGGYCVLQQLLIDTAGKPFPEWMREQVLAPLEMTHSTYEQPLPQKLAPQAAVGHLLDGKVVFGGWHVHPEMAAAGLWTTPSDLARLAIDVSKSHAHGDGRLLSQKMARAMLSRENDRFGLGFVVVGSDRALRFAHGGSNVGFRCNLVAIPATGQGIAIMTNSDNGGAMFAEIQKLAGELYDWPALEVEE